MENSLFKGGKNHNLSPIGFFRTFHYNSSNFKVTTHTPKELTLITPMPNLNNSPELLVSTPTPSKTLPV